MAAQLQPGNTRKGNPWRLAVWGTAAGLLMIPAIAMQLGAEGVHWTAFDFVVMGTLLGSCCAAYELATRMSGNTLYRLGFAVAIVLGFLLVWINLAVGIIGGEANPANLVFAGVLAVGLVGALIGRFTAGGMFRAMVAAGRRVRTGARFDGRRHAQRGIRCHVVHISGPVPQGGAVTTAGAYFRYPIPGVLRMTTKAYGAHAADKPVEAIAIERRAPGVNDVQIDIAYCGVCHSDLHTVRSEWPGTLYPCVPGHEIVGHVSAVA